MAPRTLEGGMSGGVIEFKVGDLLIEETPPPWAAPPDWKPRTVICVEHVPDRDRARHISILVEGRVIWADPDRWRVLASARDDLCNGPLPVVE